MSQKVRQSFPSTEAFVRPTHFLIIIVPYVFGLVFDCTSLGISTSYLSGRQKIAHTPTNRKLNQNSPTTDYFFLRSLLPLRTQKALRSLE